MTIAEMTSRSAVLVENVAQALSWAIEDPSGHQSWNTSVFSNLSSEELCGKRRRGAEETKQAATVFDSSQIPPIGVHPYLSRLCATFRCSDATFIAALIVVDRVLGYDGGRLPITMRNVHRLFLGALVVAVKYHEDLVYANSHYAKSGGVRLREVNRLERTILLALDFDLRVSPEQYRLYEDILLNWSRASPTQALSPSGPGAPQKPADNRVPESPQADTPATAAAQATVAADDETPSGENVEAVTEQRTPTADDQQGKREDAASAPDADQQGDQKGAESAAVSTATGASPTASADGEPEPAVEEAVDGEKSGIDDGEKSGTVSAAVGAGAALAAAAAGYPAKPGNSTYAAAPVTTLPGLSANAILMRPLGMGGFAEPVVLNGRRCAYAEMIKAHREIIQDFGGLVTIVNEMGRDRHALIGGSACAPCNAVDVTPPPPCTPWAPS